MGLSPEVTTVLDLVLPAYIDPGTGSLVWQLVVGGVLGTAFAIKLQWRRLKASLARLVGASHGN